MLLHSPHPPSNTGREDDDHRLMTDAEEGRSIEINNSGAYPTCCIQLSLDGLAVNTVLQSQNINDYEGASGSSISFDCIPQVGGCMVDSGVCVCVCVCPLVFLSSIPRHPSSLPHHTRHPLRSSWKEAVEQHSLFTTKQHCVPALSSTPTVILNPPIECFKSICDSPRAQITEKEA